MTSKRSLPLLAVLAALAAAGLPISDSAAADGHRARDGERTMAERSVSLDEAVAQAERRYKARAVRAEEKRHGDRIEYRIRLLGDDGRVFEVRIDAATGSEN
jgi:uncharacterized membrane protein YkoI